MNDPLLQPDGYLKLLPSRHYEAVPHYNLRIWCHRNARYGVPTIETVSWLRDLIGTRRAIEIGSGSGDLAYHLGIPATDNRMQDWPHIREYYVSILQPTIRYPDAIECLTAAQAIEKYDPEVVVASWVTEWIDPDLPPPPQGGNIYGVKEDAIVQSGVTYVLIGHTNVHSHKNIMALPHRVYDLPFVRSRGADPTGNRIWVWNG